MAVAEGFYCLAKEQKVMRLGSYTTHILRHTLMQCLYKIYNIFTLKVAVISGCCNHSCSPYRPRSSLFKTWRQCKRWKTKSRSKQIWTQLVFSALNTPTHNSLAYRFEYFFVLFCFYSTVTECNLIAIIFYEKHPGLLFCILCLHFFMSIELYYTILV